MLTFLAILYIIYRQNLTFGGLMFYQFDHLTTPDYIKIETGENFSFPMHLHQCFELIVLTDGEMTVNVDGKDYRLGKGDALLVFPNQLHMLSSSHSRHILCIFSPKLVQAFTAKTDRYVPENNLFSLDDCLRDLLVKLGDASYIERKGVLYGICGRFDRNAVYKAKPSDSKSLLNRIFAFVEENFADDCSLTALSEKTGYDYAYLSRFFRKAVGLPYNDYLNRYRLSHACYLLTNTSMPVVRCAYESGYSSLRTFNRNFKAMMNTTPALYRQSEDIK